MLIKLVFLLFFIKIVGATSFAPVSVSEQVKESDATLKVQFLSQESFKDKNGRIKTRHKFKILNYINETQEKEETVDVVIPGGEYEGVISKVEGVPEFSEKEKSLILIKKNKDGTWGYVGLALAKFKIIEKDGKENYVREDSGGDTVISDEDINKIVSDSEAGKKLEINVVKTDSPSGVKSNLQGIALEKEIPTSSTNQNVDAKSVLWVLVFTALFILMMYFLLTYKKK